MTLCFARSESCRLSGMASAKRLEELVVWQLACELRDAIELAVKHGSARQDFDFKDQILRSSRSTPANIAEGFGHFRPRQFAKYLRIARASLMETRNHLHKGDQRYFSSSDAQQMRTLVIRILSGISRLVRYLDSCPADFDLRTQFEDSDPSDPPTTPNPKSGTAKKLPGRP